MNEIVKHYVTFGEHGMCVDVDALERNSMYREAAIQSAVKQIKGKPDSCVFLPSYKEGSALGPFINGLVMHPEVKNLKTTNIKDVLKMNVEEVLVVKQSFKTGAGLKRIIGVLKSHGFKVSIFCLVAHSSTELERFAYENGIEAYAAVSLDEIPYVK
jgi:hypothetical protein